MSNPLRFVPKYGIDNNSLTIINIANPVNAQDAAPKSYVTNASNLATGTIIAGVMPAHTGDVTSTAGTVALTLATVTQSTGASFVKITLDTKGRVTGNTAVAQADITGLLGAGSISNTMLANAAVANLSGTNTGNETTASVRTLLGITTLSGINTGDQTIQLTGDVTGSGAGSFAATLANTTVTAGGYGSSTTSPTFTVDAKGRLTDASSVTITPAFSSLTGLPTTLAGHGITDAAPLAGYNTHIADATLHLTSTQNTWIDAITVTSAEVNTLAGIGATAISTQLGGKLALSGGTMTGSLTIQTGQKITITDLPVAGTDAANKNYVDANLAGLSWKQSVKVASTANVVIATGTLLTIDGILLVAGDRVLLKDQSILSQNGIYVAGAGAWTRASDMDQATAPNEINSAAVFVNSGTANANTGWTQINSVVTLNTDPIAWVQFNGAAGTTAGTGLTKTGNTLSVLLGAGIVSLPTAEVGVDLYSTGGLMLTTDGTATSTLTNAQLSLTKIGTAGTYISTTVDAYGRVTAGTNPTTIAGYGLTNVVEPHTSVLTALGGLSAVTTGLVKLTNGVASLDSTVYVTNAQSFALTGGVTASGSLTTGTFAATVVTNANLTGHITSVGNATTLGSFTSAQLLSALTDETGTGSVVFASSPTLTTPALGTPSALVGTNITGTASGLTAGTVTTNANMTGAVTSVGNATSLGSFTSAQLLAALTDETGTGSAVFATSPTLVTPLLGTPTSGVLTNCTGTAAGLTAGTVTTNANLTGEVTSVGNAATLSNAAVISKVITGYVSGAGTVAATDTIVQAINKLNGNISLTATTASPTFTGTTTSPIYATANGIITSASLTTAATTANQVAASINAVAYRSAIFQVQAVSATSYHSTQVMVIHDGTNVTIQENFTMFTGVSLITCDASIAGGALQLLVTPTNAVTTIKTMITAINV